MSSPTKIRVAVLYGGRSGEHEISLLSAASVVRNLDRGRYEIIPVAIDKSGRWLLHRMSDIAPDAKALPVRADRPVVVLPPQPGRHALHPLDGGDPVPIDVIFPVMHGPLCEDGTVQGLFELAEIPYVGCGVLASAAGMDKDITKRLCRDAGLRVVPWVTLRGRPDERRLGAIVLEIGLPCFVKPANLGSSVGVTKAKSLAELATAIDAALAYDTKVLVEKAIDAREIEVAVLENAADPANPLCGAVGEIRPRHEFYSYDAKYLDDNGAELLIPAEIPQSVMVEARELATRAFVALEGEGLARVDLFLDRRDGLLYFNEVNTLPGFTQISMYPKLWGAAGVGYAELLTRLIDLALARHARRGRLTRTYG